MMLLLIFFFKQKTAYEMRISDWSSDVCSSDLCGRSPGRRASSFRACRCGRCSCAPPSPEIGKVAIADQPPFAEQSAGIFHPLGEGLGHAPTADRKSVV